MQLSSIAICDQDINCVLMHVMQLCPRHEVKVRKICAYIARRSWLLSKKIVCVCSLVRWQKWNKSSLDYYNWTERIWSKSGIKYISPLSTEWVSLNLVSYSFCAVDIWRKQNEQINKQIWWQWDLFRCAVDTHVASSLADCHRLCSNRVIMVLFPLHIHIIYSTIIIIVCLVY